MHKPGRIDQMVELLRPRRHRIGAEIGVERGKMTVRLLRELPDIKMYLCVDPYKAYGDFCETRGDGMLEMFKPQQWQELLDVYREMCTQRLARWRDKVVQMFCMSRNAARVIKDRSLDWVFIDANHSYAYVSEDIRLWMPKVRKDGLVAGHDVNKKGVRRAIEEQCPGYSEGLGNTWWVWRTDVA